MNTQSSRISEGIGNSGTGCRKDVPSTRTRRPSLPAKANPERRGRPRKSDKFDARAAILSAAEDIFTAKGMQGASMREIALQAGINPSLVPYHFQTKEHLYKELIDRRARCLNERRDALLMDLEEKHAPGFPPLEAVFACFVRPVFELKEKEPGAWSKFTQLLFNEAGSDLMREVMQTNISPIFRRFATILQRLLPAVRQADIIFILEMTLQTTVIASPRHARIMLDDQLQAEWNDEELEMRIVQSMTAAAQSLAASAQE